MQISNAFISPSRLVFFSFLEMRNRYLIFTEIIIVETIMKAVFNFMLKAGGVFFQKLQTNSE